YSSATTKRGSSAAAKARAGPLVSAGRSPSSTCRASLRIRRPLGARCVLVVLRATAPERRLEQVRERMHVAQLAVLDPEQVRVGGAAAAVRAAGAERAEHDDRPRDLVDDEAPVCDVHATRHADLAA